MTLFAMMWCGPATLTRAEPCSLDFKPSQNMQNKLLYFGGNFKNSIFSIYLPMLFCRVCVCVNMCVCVCVHGHTWKPEVNVRCSLRSLSTLFFWELKLAILPRLAGCKLPGSIHLISLTLGLQMCADVPGLYVGPGDLNSGPHAYTANTFLTEPSLQPFSPL